MDEMLLSRAHTHGERPVTLHLDEAVALPVAARLAMARRFFDAHPGGGRKPPGLGQALIDFIEWETASGRVVDRGGSPWWKAVNGYLVTDLNIALSRSTERLQGMPTVAAWRAYVDASESCSDVCEARDAFWVAHSRSIIRGVEKAAPLLELETADERAFATLVLSVLAQATRTREASDSQLLGERVRRSYPRVYPIPSEELAGLVRLRGSRPRSGDAVPPGPSPTRPSLHVLTSH